MASNKYIAKDLDTPSKTAVKLNRLQSRLAGSETCKRWKKVGVNMEAETQPLGKGNSC